MEKQEQLNVVIVDDNPMVLSTLDEMINAEDGLTVIGKADNGEDAIDMIKDTTPDIVLLDMVMIIEPCISTPADMKGRVDVGFAPLHNLHQFRPILYFLEIVVLHRSAGNNKTVITLIFDLVKGCIEGVQVFRRRVAGTIRTGIEKIHIYLDR